MTLLCVLQAALGSACNDNSNTQRCDARSSLGSEASASASPILNAGRPLADHGVHSSCIHSCLVLIYTRVMVSSMLQQSACASSASLHAVKHAAHLGFVTRPFVQAQHRAHMSSHIHKRRMVLVASSQEMEITLKADEVRVSHPVRPTYHVDQQMDAAYAPILWHV